MDNNNSTSDLPRPPSPPKGPTRPIKRARTAYFIFSDENRAKVVADHPGEGATTVARMLGQIWSNMTPEQKEVYTLKSAQEREWVSKQMEQYKSFGGELISSQNNHNQQQQQQQQQQGVSGTAGTGSSMADTHLTLPLARIRKICKLDPEVRGVSKEGLLLITKCAELVTTKLGLETVRVAYIQNRRTLLPEDVAQVCATKEQFLFLKEDVRDLAREQVQQKQQQQHQQQQKRAQEEQQQEEEDHGEGGDSSSATTTATRDVKASSKLLTAYFRTSTD